jgi:hypothetical protein
MSERSEFIADGRRERSEPVTAGRAGARRVRFGGAAPGGER